MDLKALFAGLLVGIGCFCWTGPIASWLGRVVARFEISVQEVLSQLFMFDVTPRSVTMMVFGFMAFMIFVFFLMFGNLIGLILGAAIGLALPIFFIYQMVVRRRAKLESQLLDGLITLANGMRAGLNLGQALALVEHHGEKPLSQEFGLILREIEHGTSIDVALNNASSRLHSHNFRLLFAAMKTTRVRGGNMPETLDRLGESLREIVRLEQKVKAQTAQGRMSAIFMGIMPAVVLGIYYLIEPEGVRLLFTESIGHLILLIGLVFNVLGFVWIRKIVAFDI
jgi:tight adherence protein B